MNTKPIKILFVDDDEDDFIIARDLLREIRNRTFEIDWASSFSKALEQIKKNEHDVYLVDYRLGENTGIGLLKEAIAAGCDQPFIMLTGKGDHKIDMEAMQAGASDYLVKDKIDAFTLERCIRYSIERKQAIEAIKESEKKFRNIFEQSKDVVFTTNHEGDFIDINKSALQVFGYSKIEFYEQNIAQLFANEDEMEDFKDIISDKREVTDFEATLLTKNQERRYCLVTLSLQPGHSDDETFYQGIIHDITNRKRAEQELMVSEKLAVTGRIAQIIAHEVRNPLTNVNLSMEQLRHDVNNGEFDVEGMNVYFDIITRNCDRINQLITEMLNSSKPAELKFTSYSLKNIMEESLELANDRIALKGIKVEKQFDTEGRKVFIDPEKIKIALLNIVINAVEAMEPKKGILTIKNEVRNSKCLISISDNGAGISNENLRKLFDPFYSGKPKGMGLGLTTSQNIVLNHKGTIDVESEPGKGTTFIIGLDEA